MKARLEQREVFLLKWRYFFFREGIMPMKEMEVNKGMWKWLQEQKFGTNVLKIIDFIYTNKMLYGIIRIAFVLPGSFQFYY